MTSSAGPAAQPPLEDRHRQERLREIIEHAAHYLPAQGPITVFIHHNTLHAFEDYSFNEGVERGAKLFGCEPYLPESRYRELLHQGRFTRADVDEVLLNDLGDEADRMLGFLGTRFRFRQAMLHYPLQSAPTAELEWFIAETDALARFRGDAPGDARRRMVEATKHWILRDHRNGGVRRRSNGEDADIHALLGELMAEFGPQSLESWSDAAWEAFTLQALWRICRESVGRVQAPTVEQSDRRQLRDALLTAAGRDIDLMVNEEMVRFCAAFIDQGVAHFVLPDRRHGLWRSFCSSYRGMAGLRDAWLAPLERELERIERLGLGSLAIIEESLEALGVPENQWEDQIIASLLALRGWAGMVRQLETRQDRAAFPIPVGSLIEYLAVRLLLERLAAAHVAREELGYRGPLDQLFADLSSDEESSFALTERRAFQVFQLAQVLGWQPSFLAQLSNNEWRLIVEEIEGFPEVSRRRIFHAALERRYRVQMLDALVRRSRSLLPSSAPAFQAIFCIDEREESFRRHLEEIAPQAETFGAAGFFGVAMYYRGSADAHFTPLCPIVVRPQHWVTETALATSTDDHVRQRKAHRTIGAAFHKVHHGSRTFLGGAVVAGLGVLATLPLVARVLFPRWTGRLRRRAAHLIAPPPQTELNIERTTPSPGATPESIGYTVEEMAAVVRRLLEDIGAVNRLARLVVVVGHGSSSVNNPHKSAYDCGACGGSPGGANARAVCRMANDPRVRARLANDGVMIGAETVFIGALHNTCNDAVTWFDADRIPASHQEDLRIVQAVFDQTRERNAHERCRRFVSAPLSLTPEAALRHVEARAEDLSQVRPECGHASNASCIVGRRSRTRGLFLDRRAFLVSYDPERDGDDQPILTRILQAVIPVCAGISLEYYFSYVDNTGFGCGTKLPHNIASLLGVMDGAASDLRTGLPWQMVEIHDPLRLLFVIETTPQAVLAILERNPALGKLCENGWVQIATLSPSSAEVHVLCGHRFERYHAESETLPTVSGSIDWYRGWREHLGFALIEDRTPPGKESAA